MQELGKTSKDSPITLEQISKEIGYCNQKILDNVNISRQLQKENKALRITILLLKQKRHEIIFGAIES